jgi:hypothetical protein
MDEDISGILARLRQISFEETAKPLIKWLNENGHPHMTIIVTTTHAELLEGVCAINTNEFVKD